MMMRLLVRNYFKFSQKFKIDDYDNQDYATMCGLLKEKYQLNNEEIQTSGLIKLIDEEGKVIGIYTASEARKKSKALGMDMVLVNKKVTPFICRASDFRNRIIDKFYNQIILKRQKERTSVLIKS
jgi:translation initiation factor IF-3